MGSSILSQRRQWHPTPVLLPGKSHGWRSLVGCSPWGREELDMTERLHFHFSLSLEKEIATHSSVFAWRIPGTGSHRDRHDWSDLAEAAASWTTHLLLRASFVVWIKRREDNWHCWPPNLASESKWISKEKLLSIYFLQNEPQEIVSCIDIFQGFNSYFRKQVIVSETETTKCTSHHRDHRITLYEVCALVCYMQGFATKEKSPLYFQINVKWLLSTDSHISPASLLSTLPPSFLSLAPFLLRNSS